MVSLKSTPGWPFYSGFSQLTRKMQTWTNYCNQSISCPAHCAKRSPIWSCSTSSTAGNEGTILQPGKKGCSGWSFSNGWTKCVTTRSRVSLLVSCLDRDWPWFVDLGSVALTSFGSSSFQSTEGRKLIVVVLLDKLGSSLSAIDWRSRRAST